MLPTTSFGARSCINPNRSLDRYCAICYIEYNFLPSFIFLLASCFSFVLAVARYAFELTENNLLNNPMKSVQNLMTDLGLIRKAYFCDIDGLLAIQRGLYFRSPVSLSKPSFLYTFTLSERHTPPNSYTQNGLFASSIWLKMVTLPLRTTQT